MLLVSHLQERGDSAVATHNRGGATVPHHTAKVMILPRFGLDGMHSTLYSPESLYVMLVSNSVGRLFQGQMLCKLLCDSEHPKEVRRFVAMVSIKL